MLETTVQQVITVHERGKVVRKIVPVVRRVKVRPKTIKKRSSKDEATQLRHSTRVVTIPGKVRTVRRVVTTLVPVVKKRVVTVKGKTHTVVQTRRVPTTRVQTQTIVLTQTQTHAWSRTSRRLRTRRTSPAVHGHAEQDDHTAPQHGHEDGYSHEDEDQTDPAPLRDATVTLFQPTTIISSVISTVTTTVSGAARRRRRPDRSPSRKAALPERSAPWLPLGRRRALSDDQLRPDRHPR